MRGANQWIIIVDAKRNRMAQRLRCAIQVDGTEHALFDAVGNDIDVTSGDILTV